METIRELCQTHPALMGIFMGSTCVILTLICGFIDIKISSILERKRFIREHGMPREEYFKEYYRHLK